MAEPTKQELLGAFLRLHAVSQEMFGAYANDVAPGRAEKMQALIAEANSIAQPMINRFPFEKIERAGE